jgi:hypothetical protein
LQRDKEENSSTVVPKGLISFLKTPQYFKFLEALLEYCRELFRLENKQTALELESK